MRPHQLTVQAFGPFPGSVELDLDRLSDGGLFLLHGDTGAGKTTLLDALGFALYGKVPGVRGKVGRLRADSADPAVRTTVVLTVTLGSRLLRITRHPAQEQPKRGGGSRTVNASVVLEEDRGSGWETLSTRLDEAGAELDALLGMTADQFFQVVLLPQGEFATFLRAKSDDRRQVLQRLFGTKRFEDIEKWMVTRSKLIEGQVAEASATLERLRHRVAQAAGAELPEPGTEATGWVRELLDRAEGDRDAADAAVARVQQQRDAAQQARDVVERLAGLQQRRRTALAREQEVVGQVEQVQALQDELAAAVRAAGLAGVLAAAEERAQEQADAVSAEARCRARLPEAGLSVDLTSADLQETAEAAGKRLVRLEGLSGVADDLTTARAAVAATGLERRRHEATLASADELLADLPARRSQAVEQLEEARSSADLLPQAQSRLGVLREAAAEATGLARVSEELTGLRERRLAAGERQLMLRTRAEELREQRFEAIFGELAAKLEDGAPCEVCGATEHPDPYLGDADEVTREQAAAAQAEAEQAAKVYARLDTDVELVEAAVTGHERRLAAAEVDVLTLPGLLEAQEQETARLVAAASVLRDCTDALDEVNAEQAAAEKSQALALAACDALSPREQQLSDTVGRLERALAGQLGEDNDLATAQLRTARVEQVCDAVLAAVAETARARKELDRARQQLVRQTTEAGFDDPEGAAAASREVGWRDEAAARVQEHAEQVAAVREQLAQPELQVALEPPAGTAAAAALVLAQDAELRSAVGASSLVVQRHRALADLLPEVEAAERQLEPLAARATEVRALAELCSGAGANTLKMTLTSFVLAARLEEVAAAATIPLLKMTQGRYALIHSDGAVKGGARSGLELLARDSWTGEDRPVSTLSGGETFQASLALALGLAEVVQAEAGGARLDALFVDEGFGSLDEETLNEVMDVLDGLREGGRVVGVVSHVAELRDRIPAQVHVTKGRAGSTLSIQGC